MKGSKLNLRNSRIPDVKVQSTLGLRSSVGIRLVGLELVDWAELWPGLFSFFL
jgi:hypothetical protein